MKFLDAPISPPLGTLHIAWSEVFGFRIWREPGGEPMRVKDLWMLLAVVLFVVLW